jgi:ParB family chromosome partitioning protein
MSTQQKYENSIFWIDVEKIKPNPYQPRREFDEERLGDLSESIRQYGILQPLTVSRVEIERPLGGIAVEYELIAGERRLRASKLAGLAQVPCIIRIGDDSKAKLELAIIENLQREDLNPVDRAKSFQRLAEEFNLKHNEIGKKMSKSREYVSNTMRLLTLPQEILDALERGRISEGHTRPLLMLGDRPAEQITLFKEMLMRKMTVREAEGIARRIAYDKVRKKDKFHDPDIADMEGRLAESLGTRVHIEKKEVGGKILIDFFSYEELQGILTILESKKKEDILGLQNSLLSGGYIAPLVQREELVPVKTNTEIQKVNEQVFSPTPVEENFYQNIPAAQNYQNQNSVDVTKEEIVTTPQIENTAPDQSTFLSSSQILSYTPKVEEAIDNSTSNNMFKVFDENIWQKPEEVRDAVYLDDRDKTEIRQEEKDDDLYNIKNFSI